MPLICECGKRTSHGTVIDICAGHLLQGTMTPEQLKQMPRALSQRERKVKAKLVQDAVQKQRRSRKAKPSGKPNLRVPERKSKRKQRSDKGKKRGPYGPRTKKRPAA